MRLRSIVLTTALALLAGQAGGQSPPKDRPLDQCFRQSDIENSVQASQSHLNLKISGGRYFQVQTRGVCFTSPGFDPYVLKVRGSDLVCQPVDMDLSAGPPGFKMSCIIDRIVPMTRQQVMALPRREQP